MTEAARVALVLAAACGLGSAVAALWSLTRHGTEATAPAGEPVAAGGGAGLPEATVPAGERGADGGGAGSAPGRGVGSGVARLLLLGAGVAAGFAVVVLGRALADNDFSLTYVADNSRRGASTPYRVAALWGGMAGSLMFFAALVGVVGWLAARGSRRHGERVAAAVAGIAGGLLAALVGLVLAFADPFEQLDLPAIEGRGLTPILEHPAMVYHPPLLYLGLVTLLPPFALALATADAATTVRRWLVVPWTLLAVGMVAGAHWAYVEVGWGGYWAWDPVENTALLPWLAVTLALHASLSARSGRGFAGLVSVAFVLALAGTMLTRSGAVPSVHAFGEDESIGRGLAVLLGVVAAGAAVVVARRPRGPGSPVPWLVAAHLAVVGAVLAVAVAGTAAPLVSDLTGGDDIAVEGRYFAQFTGPLAVVGLALVALVPIAHGRARGRAAFAAPAAGAVVGGVVLWFGGGDLDAPSLILAAAAGAALVSSILAAAVSPAAGGTGPDAAAEGTAERAGTAGDGAGLGAAAQPAGTAGGRRRGRRVAPHVAHAGLGLLLLGVAGTATGTTELVPVEPGGSVEVGGEVVGYEGVEVDGSSEPATVTATVRTNGRELRPSLAAYPERRVLLPETSLVSTPLRDVQVGLRTATDDGTATLQIGVYPLQVLVWWGALLLVAGGVVLLLTKD